MRIQLASARAAVSCRRVVAETDRAAVTLGGREANAADVREIHRMNLASLAPSACPRLHGVNERTGLLHAVSESALPPIPVRRKGMRIVGALHRRRLDSGSCS